MESQLLFMVDLRLQLFGDEAGISGFYRGGDRSIRRL